MIIKQGKIVTTDIYFKDTDSKQYLDFKSCHPKHTKTNIPFCLARRICTIVSDRQILNFRLNELANVLLKRKYPVQIIRTGFIKAMQLPRSSLLCEREKSDKNIMPYISTNNPKIREVFGMLKNNLDIIYSDHNLTKIFNDTKIINCKRQLHNLKNILVKSKFE